MPMTHLFRSFLRATRPGSFLAQHFLHDRGHIPRIVDTPMISALPNEAQRLDRQLQTFRPIIV